MNERRPVQVFTDIKSVQTPSRNFVTQQSDEMIGLKDSVNLSSLDRQIRVTGVGEMSLPPDRFSLTIRCKAVKESVQEAKLSVTRRLDYIVQSLNNVNLKDTDYRVYQHAHHQADTTAVYESQVEAHFLELDKCLAVSNLLVEKLGPGVQVSLPVCYHANGSLDRLRKQVSMLAIHNARQKAMEMSKVIHLSVGTAVQVEEQDFTESCGSTADTDDLDPTTSPGLQQRVNDKTVSMSSRVCVSFHLKPSHSKKKL